MTSLQPYMLALARLLMSHMYLLSGFQKITGFAGTQQYMDSQGVPGMLLPLAILVELGGGLAVLVGWQTRWASLLLAGFTVVAAVLFHWDFADRMQVINLMKNFVIAGGFLALAAAGPGALSFDKR